jgi:ubiquinone biosynthesis protein
MNKLNMNQRKRLEDIGTILIKYGFEEVVKEIIPISARLRLRGLRPQIGEEGIYVRLREALSELGPTFIKFGHYMRTRPDLLPPELVKELELLPDKTREPIPYDEVKKIVEEKIGNIDEIFIEIKLEPLSSGSLSQKHVATLKEGDKVVLKIKRPDISDVIDTDLRTLDIIAQHAGKISAELKLFNFPEVVKEFSMEIRKELDFVEEGKSAELLSKEMAEFTKIRVPRTYWKYTSEDILVIEYIEGVAIDHVDEITSMGVNTRELALLCIRSYLKQIFIDGFYHGDPEQENLIVTSRGELAFIDFGLMGVLRRGKRDLFTQLMVAAFEDDADEVVRSMEGLGLWGRSEDRELLKDDIYIVLKEAKLKTSYVSGNKLASIVTAVRKRDLGLPMQSMLAINTLLKVDLNMKALYPDFKLMDETNSYLRETAIQRTLDLSNLRKSGSTFLDTIQSSKDLPQHMNDALLTITEGPIRFKLDYENLDNLSKSVDNATYRILIAVALVILSSQNITIFNFPMGTLIAYLLAVSIGAFAVYKLFLIK